MKNNILILTVIFLIPILSCQEKSERSLVETETNVIIDIPIIAESVGDEKSGLSILPIDYSFSGENSYSVSNIADSEKGILKIQKVKPVSGTVLSISGIKEANEIYSLRLEWGYKSSAGKDYIMFESIDLLSINNTLKDEIFSVNLDEAIVQLINSINSQESSIIVKITGNSNFNLNSIAKLEIPVIVVSETITPRFELF
jgi:hypothetical protein